MFESLVGSFLGSTQGQGAAQVLMQQGVPPQQIQGLLTSAFSAAGSALHERGATSQPAQPALGVFDLLGGHPGQSFLIGAATALLRGEGLTGALEDGAIGMVGGHVGEVVASHLGVDRTTAARISAAITPFMVGYIHEHVSGHHAVVAKHGELAGDELVRKKQELAAIAAKNAAAGWPPKKP